jgi:excisionase family DNA binding protein
MSEVIKMSKPDKGRSTLSRPYYTVKQAAGALGYSEPSVRRMVAAGVLTAGQLKKGAQVRINGESVEAVKSRLDGDGS